MRHYGKIISHIGERVCILSLFRFACFERADVNVEIVEAFKCSSRRRTHRRARRDCDYSYDSSSHQNTGRHVLTLLNYKGRFGMEKARLLMAKLNLRTIQCASEDPSRLENAARYTMNDFHFEPIRFILALSYVILYLSPSFSFHLTSLSPTQHPRGIDLHPHPILP